MEKYVTTIIFVLVCQSAYAEVFGCWPEGGGNIVIAPTGEPVQASGFLFAAAPGILTHGANAAPFDFFIPNSARPGKVVIGSLGSRVTIDGPLEIEVSVSASAVTGDIVADWDGAGVLTRFLITPCSVPEPASVSMVSIGVVGLLGWRARRTLVTSK